MINKILIVFVLFIGSICFSQELKLLNIQDSISRKYPERNEAVNKIDNLVKVSKVSKNSLVKVITKKIPLSKLGSLPDDKFGLVISYFRNHYVWILLDNTLKNFTDEEITEISEKFVKGGNKVPLLKRFREIEKQSVAKFESEF